MSRKRIAFPAFLPDQLPRNVLTRATNVFPAVDGYRPVKSLAAISDPLPASFRGGGAFISSDGSAYLLAGTANGLARYTAGEWDDLIVGMSVADRWRFAQFGNYVVAVNGVDTKQVDLTAGSASDLSAAPTGNGVAVVGDFVVITQAGGDKLLVQWSAFNDHTAWTPAVDQAGFQPMLTGGEVKGIAGGEYGVILQRFRLVRMERTGDDKAPFSFAEITPNFGCASAGSIAQAGRTVFFLSDRGFMALEDGQSLKPIGNEKFDQTFRDSVSPDDYEKLWAAVDPKRSLVMWGMPGTPGRIWVYNWVLDRASTIEMPFSGFFAGYESSMTLEEVAAVYPNLDTMPYSLDDPRFQGGDPRLYVVSNDNEVGALSGPTLEATLTLGWVALADPNVARVRAVWPITDAISGVTVSIDARQQMGGAQDVTIAGEMQASGRAPLRCRGKYLSATVKHAAGSAWTYSQGFDVDFEAGGLR
ncbi:MAG: hypothetical protein J7500_15775 [Sphingomonas sp.]|uniref:hypothetical protein n=1 Tax=Sphingomonas sp. TaxID=28214 RepID=UPI001AFE9579|nr:hypothetical protein [Sphingomonas sp.]MBO9624167.1 hypothetical protein [Sphingomonas sp.]